MPLRPLGIGRRLRDSDAARYLLPPLVSACHTGLLIRVGNSIRRGSGAIGLLRLLVRCALSGPWSVLASERVDYTRTQFRCMQNSCVRFGRVFSDEAPEEQPGASVVLSAPPTSFTRS